MALRVWDSVTHRGDQDNTPGLVLAFATIWGINQLPGPLSQTWVLTTTATSLKCLQLTTNAGEKKVYTIVWSKQKNKIYPWACHHWCSCTTGWITETLAYPSRKGQAAQHCPQSKLSSRLWFFYVQEHAGVHRWVWLPSAVGISNRPSRLRSLWVTLGINI